MTFFALLIAICSAGLALSLIMATVWKVQEATHNTGWIDVFWTFGMGCVGVIVSLFPIASDPASPARKIMVALLVALWSLRLGQHILRRTLSVGDDPRYRRWIEEWGSNAKSRMFWHLQSQAAVGLVFALAVILAAHNARPNLNLQDLLAPIILLAVLVGEAIADRQLRHFKADPAHRNKICDVGLWSWSRHPNYFFEWVVWFAYPIIAIDVSGHNPYGWLALLAPACMYWILIYVSGIPPLEAHMLRSKREAFLDYKRRTSAFFPLPPRR